MKKDSKYVWYLFDITVFVIINLIVLTHLPQSTFVALSSLNAFEYFILALGLYRLVDIITKEGVTEVIRAPFMERTIVDEKETWKYSERGIRGFFAILFSCNACMGVWISMIMFYLYLSFPLETFIFMVIMSLTGLERFFSKLENLLAKLGRKS